jgi:starch synthase
MTLKILAVTSEIYPLIKTGGLADVAGALPAALKPEGVEVRTVVPGYPAVMAALSEGETVMTIGDAFGAPARLVAGKAKGLDIIALDAQHLFARPGNPYLGPDGKDWPDNWRRFAALSRAAADVALGAMGSYRPDVVHAHDWQAGLTFAYTHFAPARPGSVLTIHNLAFQGQFAPALFPALGLPAEAFSADGVEYYGALGYLKAGIYYADRITTVSPGYAAEIRTPEEGMGMDGLLRARSGVMSGILNGIDEDAWNPKTDPHLAANYTKRNVTGARALNKAALQARLGLDQDPSAPVFSLPCWVRAIRAWSTASASHRGCIPAASAAGSAMMRVWRTRCWRDPTSFWCRRVSSPAASRRCTACAMAPCRWWPASAACPTRWSMPTPPRSAAASPTGSSSLPSPMR